jgi:hypothetical protein
MDGKDVKFSGTISHLTTEKTSNKFEGSGKLFYPESTSFIVQVTKFTLTISLSLTLSVTLLDKLLGIDCNFIFPPSGTVQNSGAEIVIPPEPLSQNLKALGIDSYVVVVKEVNQYSEATELEYHLRKNRVYAKHLIYNAKYYVYVGPLYAKQRATSALNAATHLGYSGAYILFPE